MALFRVNVGFRNMRRGELVEIPDDELGDEGPWSNVMKYLRPVEAEPEFEVLAGAEYVAGDGDAGAGEPPGGDGPTSSSDASSEGEPGA